MIKISTPGFLENLELFIVYVMIGIVGRKGYVLSLFIKNCVPFHLNTTVRLRCLNILLICSIKNNFFNVPVLILL